MDNYQFFTILGSLAAGFGWMMIRFDRRLEKIDNRLNDIERRLTVVETILSMMGAPIGSGKTGTHE